MNLTREQIEYLSVLVGPEVQHAVTQCSLHQQPSDYEHLIFVRGLFRKLQAELEQQIEARTFDDLNSKLSPQPQPPANAFAASVQQDLGADAGASFQ